MGTRYQRQGFPKKKLDPKIDPPSEKNRNPASHGVISAMWVKAPDPKAGAGALRRVELGRGLPSFPDSFILRSLIYFPPSTPSGHIYIT